MDHNTRAGDTLIRPFDAETDRAFIARVGGRLDPGPTISPRDQVTMQAFFGSIGDRLLSAEPSTVAFVAVRGDLTLGLISVHPDRDYFTEHPRAYVDVLVVDADAEGQGIGRLLLRHAEDWARHHGFREVVLDVFATKTGAIAFYERCGYRPDHIRMAKPIG